jgi:putative glutathione S-transferase
MIDGQWTSDDQLLKGSGGKFVRKPTTFRDWIRADGSTPYAPESGRYHLYVSYACPWAHRTLIVRKLKRLDDHVGVSVVRPLMLDNGWELGDADTVNGKQYLHEIYRTVRSDYNGRVTVPVLWDKKNGTIVNNESSEIIRMFNGEMSSLEGVSDADYWPEDLRDAIEPLNDRIYNTVNNGVYKCGFASTQEAYDEAFAAIFDTLDDLDARLANSRYLMGDRLTEVDLRLLPTLLRFDAVYVCHFKCNKQRIVDYPNLWPYTRELYQLPGIAETVRYDHIKPHYFVSHTSINPRQTVPGGPDIDFSEPHGRG